MDAARLVLALTARGSAAKVLQILRTFDGLVPAVVGMPLAAVVVWLVSVLVRGRRNMCAPLVDAALAATALGVGILVLTPQHTVAERVQLDIGEDVTAALVAAPGDSLPWVQLAGNLVLLLPLGMLAPLRVRWLDNIGRIALAALALSSSIELTQFFFIAGRVASTDDIVLNTIGGTIGGLLVRPPWGRPATAGSRPAAPEPVQRPATSAGRPQHGITGDNDQTVWSLIARLEQERRREFARPRGREPVLTESRTP